MAVDGDGTDVDEDPAEFLVVFEGHGDAFNGLILVDDLAIGRPGFDL